VLVKYKEDIIIISSNVTYSRHDIAEKKCSFGVKQQSLTLVQFTFPFVYSITDSIRMTCSLLHSHWCSSHHHLDSDKEQRSCFLIIPVFFLYIIRGRRGCDRMVVAVPITTEVVSSNRVHGDVYSMKHYAIKFVSDLQQVGGFLRVFRFPPPIKLTGAI
jgi:hypothetical protein